MSADASNKLSKTNWAMVDSQDDAAIDTSDVPPLTDSFFSRATLRLPHTSVPVTVHIDPETLSWYREQGEDGKRKMTAALRIYADAHKAGAT